MKTFKATGFNATGEFVVELHHDKRHLRLGFKKETVSGAFFGPDMNADAVEELVDRLCTVNETRDALHLSAEGTSLMCHASGVSAGEFILRFGSLHPPSGYITLEITTLEAAHAQRLANHLRDLASVLRMPQPQKPSFGL